MRSFFYILISGLLAILSCGCDLDKLNPAQPDENGFINDGRPRFIISLNRFVEYPHAGQLEKEIECFDGSMIWINTSPMLHSKHIEKVEYFPHPDNPNFSSLKLKLDRRGKLLWMQSSIGLAHCRIVFVVDGIGYSVFRARHMADDSEWVTIDGPFNRFLCKGLAFYSESNYKFFNPSPSSIF